MFNRAVWIMHDGPDTLIPAGNMIVYELGTKKMSVWGKAAFNEEYEEDR